MALTGGPLPGGKYKDIVIDEDFAESVNIFRNHNLLLLMVL
jgi:hypothetical protein